MHKHVLPKSALIWRLKSQYKEFYTLAIKTAMCTTTAKAQSRLQIASKCRSGKQQVHFKWKSVIILLSTTPPCPSISLAKLKTHLWIEKRKSKLQTINWNQILWSRLSSYAIMLRSEYDHCWIKWRLEGISKLPEVICCLESGWLTLMTFLTDTQLPLFDSPGSSASASNPILY